MSNEPNRTIETELNETELDAVAGGLRIMKPGTKPTGDAGGGAKPTGGTGTGAKPTLNPALFQPVVCYGPIR